MIGPTLLATAEEHLGQSTELQGEIASLLLPQKLPTQACILAATQYHNEKLSLSVVC